MPNPSKQKGDRFERALVKAFRAAGMPASKVPLSGAAKGWPGDVILDGYDPPIIVQCKHFADPFKRLFAIADETGTSLVAQHHGALPFLLMSERNFFWWLGEGFPYLSPYIPVNFTAFKQCADYLEKEDILFVKRDRGSPFVLLTMPAARRLIAEPKPILKE